MRSLLFSVSCAAILCSIGSAFAQGPTPAKTPAAKNAAPNAAAAPAPAAMPATEPAVGGAPQLTRADVEAWLDGFMPMSLRTGDIAGAVVVVVKDGATLLKKGYGYSDVEKRTPVDADRTLFRPGSISKLFTWTAVMQQVEQGKLDLDADINQYLDFKIPPRDGKPITLRNIMTHTSGFEEQIKGLIAREQDGVPDLGAYLKNWTPNRIFAPGETPAYSNWATALAGYIVERVSGMPFDDYLDKNIFQPLDMPHSTFRQPLPEQLKADMSHGYPQASVTKPEKEFEIVGPAPAGALSMPGAEMAHFMIAHLQKGKYQSAQILKPETAEMMHTTALTTLPRVDRMLLGFYETNRNGHRVIAHGGDTQWFHSDLHLFIDDGVGIFLSMNSPGKAGFAQPLRESLFEQFTDRYFPGEGAAVTVDAKTAAEHAQLLVGRYDDSRRADSTFMSLLNLLGQLKVSVNEDGTVSAPLLTTPAGAPIKWREVEPFVWREEDGKGLMSARVENGRVTRFSFEPVSPFMTFQPTPGYRSGSWLVPLLCVGLGALLLTALAWPISALVRKHYGVRYALSGQDAKAHRYVRYASLATLVVFGGWSTLIALMLSNFAYLSDKTDIWVRLAQFLSPIVFFGAAAVGVWNAWHVLRSPRKWYAKAWAVLLAVSFLTVLWVALNYHLMKFGVKY
ncbi:MAG TPA: serine hydrolase domain-containing protein [Steroidobacteraceae bacterium]|nr:serine hydrolase domain-containing protein [Steroidobacteraceae bacterium]